MPAGELRESLRFERRPRTVDDGYGNREGKFKESFTTAARVTPMKGSEPVIAARLGGVQPVIIKIRSCSDARLVDPSWRAVDTRSGRIYNLRAGANFDERNQYVEFMAESGVPT